MISISKLFKKNNMNEDDIYSVVDGVSFPIEEVNDDVFSKKIMGDGIAIAPTGSIVCAPCSGELTTVFPTGHAFGITRDDGVEILVHIGLETVNLKGKGFKKLKRSNQRVVVGEKIIELDLKYLNSKKVDTTTLIIFLDKKEKNITIEKYKEVRYGNSVIAHINEL